MTTGCDAYGCTAAVEAGATLRLAHSRPRGTAPIGRPNEPTTTPTPASKPPSTPPVRKPARFRVSAGGAAIPAGVPPGRTTVAGCSLGAGFVDCANAATGAMASSTAIIPYELIRCGILRSPARPGSPGHTDSYGRNLFFVWAVSLSLRVPSRRPAAHCPILERTIPQSRILGGEALHWMTHNILSYNSLYAVCMRHGPSFRRWVSSLIPPAPVHEATPWT